MNVTSNKIIQEAKDIVKEVLQSEGSGHDWWHICRVWKMAKLIGEKEQCNLFIVELAGLLHDIADWKFHNGDENVGPNKAKEILSQLKVDEKDIQLICKIIATMSFKGAKVEDKGMETIEGKIVQDADRLDAIGAVGIARTFTYGSYIKRPIFDPTIKPILHTSKEDYIDKANAGTTINHFYEKLFLLKDRMNTETAKQIAQQRHKFMETFLEKFFREWEGKE